ncbi:MAG: flagellar hook-length control protein FliK [Brevundimonas sp.]|nr:flagellar hook-length control protein FliK [Brevundimonas sp.]
MPQPGESAAAQAQTTAAPRETGVSQLSRATIEATAQIAAQILRRLEGRSTRFEMALTPDELGRVDVKLDIDAEGRLNARLAFDNPAAATDLRGRADELRRQLEDAGFHLAADAFEFAERDSGSSAFDRGQDARNGSSRAFAAASRLNTEIDVAQPPRWLALTLSPSGVDMKV